MARLILGGALGLLLCGALSADDKKIDAKLLVGKWRLKEDKDASMVLEFGKDGKLTTTLKLKGKEEKSVDSYKVEGNTLIVTEKVGGKEETTKTVILKLTDTEMVSRRDKAKEEDTFVRIKGK
ncbi:MAG: TIGR03066 family protein [Planctomycetes bacterium]|nr:TIGR03066 family protein [Planctomycetota bacterium]